MSLPALSQRVYCRRWYAANREKVLARMAAWREAHLDEARAYEREWARSKREKKKSQVTN